MGNLSVECHSSKFRGGVKGQGCFAVKGQGCFAQSERGITYIPRSAKTTKIYVRNKAPIIQARQLTAFHYLRQCQRHDTYTRKRHFIISDPADWWKIIKT